MNGRIYRFKKEMCEFEMHLENFLFCFRSNLVMMT